MPTSHFRYLSDRAAAADKRPADALPNPLGKRLDDAPLVLAGPILRDTTPTRVTVWIAVQDKRTTCTLSVFDAATGNTVATGTSTSPISLGNRLFIYLVTASASPALQPNKVYTYDIGFGPTDTAGGSSPAQPALPSLASPGALLKGGNGIGKITYPAQAGAPALPSFALVPASVEKVRIVHASCRKPHAPGIDGFYSLSERIIKPALGRAEPAGGELARPHLLFLTGDQIYADDVADVLLFMLDDAAKALFNWVETIPTLGIAAENLTLALPPQYRPGQRQELLYDPEKLGLNPSGLTSLEAKSHLLRFAEFCAMYLFCWSDELWGTFANAEEAALLCGERWDARSRKDYKVFAEEYAHVAAFRAEVEHTRRALANVPTYMMCDDHEVTDDWFLNLAWCQNVLGDEQKLWTATDSDAGPHARPVVSANGLGERVVLNGLGAYVAFQAIGNTPDLYATGVYKDTLDALAGLADSTKFATLKGLLLPKLRIDPNGLNGTNTSGEEDVKLLYCKLTFSFTLTYTDFRIVVLDSRTKRGFSPGSLDKDPQLISKRELDVLFSAIAAIPVTGSMRVTVLVSPAPVFGHALVEWLQQYQSNRDLPFVGRPPTVDDDRDGIPDKLAEADLEAWRFNEEHLLYFTAKLTNLADKLVILSGDVHYGFSSKVRLWDATDGAASERRAVVAQFVSSATKNESPKTKTLSVRIPRSYPLAYQRGIWASDGQANLFLPNSTAPGITVPVRAYKIKDLTRHTQAPYYTVRSQSPPTMSYSIQNVQDERTPTDRGLSTAAFTDEPTIMTGATYAVAALAHRRASRYWWNRVTVGTNNLGDVHFETVGSGVLRVFQSLWYTVRLTAHASLTSDDLIKNFTQHYVDLVPPLATDPRPGV